MIRINLLPVRQAKRKEQGRIQLVIGLFVLIAAVAGNYVWARQVEGELSRVDNEVKKVKAEIKELEKIIGEVQDIEKRQKDLQQKLDILEKLRKGKTGPVKMMDALARAKPKDLWLTKFEEKNGKFVMEGQALSHEELAQFISALKSSPFFSNIQLKKADLKERNDVKTQVVEFKLAGTVNYAA
ncbi:MAG: fimbrial protein [Deltaproteobacteria bacterium]|nr:MAG: fimbrial protein [Deltaproteobacteria bacterium]